MAENNAQKRNADEVTTVYQDKLYEIGGGGGEIVCFIGFRLMFNADRCQMCESYYTAFTNHPVHPHHLPRRHQQQLFGEVDCQDRSITNLCADQPVYTF